MEHSHLVVVNKADGDLMEAAMRMQYEYTSSLKFMRPISVQTLQLLLKLFVLGNEGLFADQRRATGVVGRHARIPPNYVEDG